MKSTKFRRISLLRVFDFEHCKYFNTGDKAIKLVGEFRNRYDFLSSECNEYRRNFEFKFSPPPLQVEILRYSRVVH